MTDADLLDDEDDVPTVIVTAPLVESTPPPRVTVADRSQAAAAAAADLGDKVAPAAPAATGSSIVAAAAPVAVANAQASSYRDIVRGGRRDVPSRVAVTPIVSASAPAVGVSFGRDGAAAVATTPKRSELLLPDVRGVGTPKHGAAAPVEHVVVPRIDVTAVAAATVPDPAAAPIASRVVDDVAGDDDSEADEQVQSVEAGAWRLHFCHATLTTLCCAAAAPSEARPPETTTGAAVRGAKQRAVRPKGKKPSAAGPGVGRRTKSSWCLIKRQTKAGAKVRGRTRRPPPLSTPAAVAVENRNSPQLGRRLLREEGTRRHHR